MASDDGIEYDGQIIEIMGGSLFKIRIHPETDEEDQPEHVVLASLSGKMRKNKIHVVLGDQVKVSVSPYDASRGRITYRKR